MRSCLTIVVVVLIPCVIKLLRANKSELPVSFFCDICIKSSCTCHSFTRPPNRRNGFIAVLYTVKGLYTVNFSPSFTRLPTHRYPLIGQGFCLSMNGPAMLPSRAPEKRWKLRANIVIFIYLILPENKSNKVIDKATGFVLNSDSCFIFWKKD